MDMFGGMNGADNNGILDGGQDPYNPADAINAQYAAAEADMNRQIAAAQAAAGAHQASIGNWYNQLSSQAAANVPTIDAATASALSSSDAANKGLAEALGGGASDAAGSAASFGTITRNELAQQGQDAHQYAADLVPVMGLQGAEAKGRQMSADASVVNDLVGQLSDLNLKKAADLIQAKQDMANQGYSRSQDAWKQQMEKINLAMEMSMLPGQMKGQKLDLLSKQLGIKNDRQSLALNQLKYQLALKNGQGQATGGSTPWSQLDPGQLTSVKNNLISTLVDKRNPNLLAIDPIYAYNQMGNNLRTIGYDPKTDPSVRQWRDAVLQTYLPLWNKKHPRLRYQMKNGTIVRAK